MAQTFEDSLFQAIKKDDIKAFDALMEKAQCGAYRLGRFPVLSLMYLYKSRKIISAYEERFLAISDYEVLSEPIEISKKFASKARKCLRLYFNEVVSPLEMLLILDRTTHLKKVCPMTKPTSQIKWRLKSIYSIKYALNVKFEGGGIVLDRRPLSYREKRNLATVCVSVVLIIAIAIGAPVTTVMLTPKPIEGVVTTLSDINFNSSKTYTLTQDIILPEDYSVKNANCSINGNGNKLILGNGASLGDFNGKMSNVTVESNGEQPIFNSLSENATLENVTVNIRADMTANKGMAFVVLNNYGTVDNVTLNISGKITAESTSETVSDDGYIFGGIVQNNDYKYNGVSRPVYGVVKNCTVNYTDFSLVGATKANASFGGVAGINSGYVQDCSVYGTITADTFDIAGICSQNDGLLSGNANRANLSQVSADEDWNPVVCGIVLTNAYAVENCENSGNISSVSTCGQFEVEENSEPATSASGIAYLNRSSTVSPYIKDCTNSGDVECGAEFRSVYVAGVCLSTSGAIEACVNSGAISGSAKNDWSVYVGGITAVAFGSVYRSANTGTLSATARATAYIGGISARSCVQFTNCFSSGEITAAARQVYAGGIFGYGEIQFSGYYVYFGAVDSCISECKMTVSATETSFVGGVAGYLSERGVNVIGSDAPIYFGGCVTNSYFTGEIATGASYVGSLVGVCGVNIYTTNSFTSNNTEYHNFENNYYLEGSRTAFGATVTYDEDGNGTYALAEDKGASAANAEHIKSLEEYNKILDSLIS